MRRGVACNWLVVAVVFAAGVGAALLATGSAFAHSDGCHSKHTCPSDHHTYIWYDGAGQGWDCAKPDASERTAADTTLITYDGLPYYCHAAGSAPVTTTVATTTTATATTAQTTTTVATTTTARTTTTAPTTTAPTTTKATTTVATTTTATTTSQSKPQTPAVGKTVLLARRTQMAHCTRGTVPDRQCSPGARYSGLTKAVLCATSFHTGSIRDVPDSLKHAVEVAYGMAPKSYGRAIEIDHIISLELGGSNDIANLFPEPGSGPANYHDKDKLENKLHDLVCDNEMSLAAAQRGIATDWRTLYKRVYGQMP